MTDEPQILTNGPDPELTYACIREVERIDDEIESEKGAYMARVKAIKERRKAIIEDYRDRGLSAREIKAALKIRAQEAKIEDIRADFEEQEDLDQFDLFLDALARGEAAHKARDAAGENLTSEAAE